MKKILVFVTLLALGAPSVFAATGDVADAQNAILQSLTKLVQSYESRLTALEDEVNRLRIENGELRTRIGTGVVVTKPVPASLADAPKTPQEQKYNAIMSNVTSDLENILAANKVTATGSVGLFEFIEPNAFFVSIDDGANPAGITAFKTKVLFKYDENFKLTVLGVFDLDYKSQRYVTLRGNNPYVTAVRIKVKNSAYKGKLLEEPAALTAAGGTISASKPVATPVVSIPTPTETLVTSNGAVTLDSIRKAYDKNKLGDAIKLANAYLEQNPGNTEVLTMRARSYYIFGKFDEAITDIKTIYGAQKDGIDCGIVNDGARAEKALKWAKGTVFTDLQNTKCKKR